MKKEVLIVMKIKEIEVKEIKEENKEIEVMLCENEKD